MKKIHFLCFLLLTHLYIYLPAQDEDDFRFEGLSTQEISQVEFGQLIRAYAGKLKIENTDKLKQLGLSETHDCDEICESYFIEKATGEKMLLPASFDQGILGYLFSPSKDRLIVYSFYDGPDFEDYYDYRAEIVVFTVGAGKGLEAIKFSHSYVTITCSIEDLFWIDDQSIAIQVYEEGRNRVETSGKYIYLKTKL